MGNLMGGGANAMRKRNEEKQQWTGFVSSIAYDTLFLLFMADEGWRTVSLIDGEFKARPRLRRSLKAVSEACWLLNYFFGNELIKDRSFRQREEM